jgi:hypothetical protein
MAPWAYFRGTTSLDPRVRVTLSSKDRDQAKTAVAMTSPWWSTNSCADEVGTDGVATRQPP